MPIGEAIVEGAVQLVMEAGGEAIRLRYGWKGCVLTIALIGLIIAIAFWYFTR